MNVANDIGSHIPTVKLDSCISNVQYVRKCAMAFDKHPSIEKIKNLESVKSSNEFNFVAVNEDIVRKTIENLNPKKATGVDTLPSKLLRKAAPYISQTVQNMFNNTLVTESFPDSMKLAEVSPLLKTDENLNRKIYRPVSILPGLSKIFETLYSDQLKNHFQNLFSDLLCAFRKGYNCEMVLLNLCENWKKALDNRETVGAILLDFFLSF